VKTFGGRLDNAVKLRSDYSIIFHSVFEIFTSLHFSGDSVYLKGEDRST